MNRRDFLKMLGLAAPTIYFDMGKNLWRMEEREITDTPLRFCIDDRTRDAWRAHLLLRTGLKGMDIIRGNEGTLWIARRS